MKYSSFFLLLLISSLQAIGQSVQLKNGDLLLVGQANQGLAKAINQVTQTKAQTHFSHIAMVEKSGDQIWILQATTPNGTERIPLSAFLQKEEGADIMVYRIKANFQPNFGLAIKRAKAILGLPYNYSYILSDSAYYCSQFVYHAFAKDSIFKLAPMTFKNPKTGDFNQKWISYYRGLNIAIPQDKLGCNPNGMAASPKLKRIGFLQLKEHS